MWQVIGHDKAVGFLRRSLDEGRLSHAYLFVGPKHVGKMTLAQSLAQALNCPGEKKPCGQCSSCRRITSENHPDVQVLRCEQGSKEIGIDQIREMQHAASLKPYEGRHRVFILDGTEHLSDEGANSLLKTLEEPVPNVLIILLAANHSFLLPTITSRCHRIELQLLPIPTIEQALTERWEVAPEKARILARLCQGCIGWAITALSDEEVLKQRSQNLERLISLSEASIEEKFAYAAEMASAFRKNRVSVTEELELWRGWWRDMLLIKGNCASLITNIDHGAMLKRQSEHYSLNQSKDFIKAIGLALEQLEQNANPQLVLEVLLLDAPTQMRAEYD